MRLLKQFSVFAASLLSALTLVACDGGGTTASLTSIATTTASSSLYVAGPSTQVTVTGYYSDGRTSDLTGASTFVSSNTAVVTVDASGKVTPVAEGTAVITATNAGSGKTAATGLITVGPTPAPVLQSIAVTSASSSLTVGGATTQLTVTGTYDRGPTQDLTATATYVVNTAGIVTVSAAGVVTPKQAGTTTITATAGGKTATTGTITVAVMPAPVLQSIAVTAASSSVVVGLTTTQLTVTGTYDHGPTQDLTSSSTFTSADNTIATASTSGVVSGQKVGSTTITASAGGKTATTPISVVTSNNSGFVFWNGYAPNVAFVPFGGSTDAVTVDTGTTNNGRSSLKIVVPGANYTGGALVNSTPQNLSAFNAVQFWAKASVDTTAFSSAKGVNVMGLGNDAVGNSTFSVEVNAVPVTTTWTKFVIPLPDPSVATTLSGVFHFAEGPKGYTLWVNDIQYVNLGANAVVPTIANATIHWAAAQVAPNATTTIANTNTLPYSAPAIPGNVETNVGGGWLTLASSNSAIAAVTGPGTITGKSVGTATITGKIAGTSVTGSEVVTVAQPQQPTTSPTPPSLPAGSVVAVYSPTYSATNVWTYNAGFCGALPNPPTYAIAGGDTVLTYPIKATVNCAAWAAGGVGGSVGSPLNAAGKTVLHLDVWSPNPPPVLDIRLVDTGSSTASDFYVTYGAGLAAACTASNWCSLEIPLNTGTTSPTYSAFGQVLLVGQDVAGNNALTNPTTIFVDNFYLH